MAIKAVAVDDENLHHLIIGLTRENVYAQVKGRVVTFPAGLLTGLTEESDVVVLFAETDEGLTSGSHLRYGPSDCASGRV